MRAREFAENLGKSVLLWISDKQDAFVKGIAAEFPDVPHRYCVNQFLRDVAKPMLEADSHAKVQMRKKVRGLHSIERDALQRRRQSRVQRLPDVKSAAAAGGGAKVAEGSHPHIVEAAGEQPPPKPGQTAMRAATVTAED